MRELYGELYDNIPKLAETGDLDPAYVTFTAMQGFRYPSAMDSAGKDFRFMLVGRAVNGWDEYRGKSEPCRDSYIESAILNRDNGPGAIVRDGAKDRFEWIDTSGSVPRNAYRKGIDPETFQNTYRLTRSPLWSYTKGIWDALYGKNLPWHDRWFENIVWSNLYKIAPHKEGNPGWGLMKKQEEVCVKLLQAEIEHFDPTHIFFVTGKDWFDPFKTIFSKYNPGEKNCPRGEKKYENYVEGTAVYRTRKGTLCKVVIACRPELRRKAAYIEQVVNKFKSESCFE